MNILAFCVASDSANIASKAKAEIAASFTNSTIEKV
jgi:hypothetical protein